MDNKKLTDFTYRSFIESPRKIRRESKDIIDTWLSGLSSEENNTVWKILSILKMVMGTNQNPRYNNFPIPHESFKKYEVNDIDKIHYIRELAKIHILDISITSEAI